METKAMRPVFISYSRQDRQLASAIAQLLESHQIPSWWDAHLIGGDNFGSKIDEKLSEAGLVFVIWSDRSRVSTFVQNEARAAMEMEKLVPLLAPGFSPNRIPTEFRHLHFVSVDDHQELIRVLEKRGLYPAAMTERMQPVSEPLPTPLSIPVFDDLLRAKSEALLSRLYEVRAESAPVLQRIPITNYSHNSVSHAIQSTNLVTELFATAIADELTDAEAFALGVLCFVHDIGMESRPDMTPEQIYRSHNLYSHNYVAELGRKGLLDPDQADVVAALCLMHNKDLQRARIHFKRLLATAPRVGVIFAMFRVADMLDVETQPGEMLRIKPDIVAQVIGELEIDQAKREIVIWKGHQVSHAEFHAWSGYFASKLESLNEDLRLVEAALTWRGIDGT
jgi:TIR domain